MPSLDDTHDLHARSWVESADGHPDFPLQNLPLGRFDAGEGPRAGVAIGNEIVDLAKLCDAGLMSAAGESAARAAGGSGPAAMLSLDEAHRTALRRDLFKVLQLGSVAEHMRERILHSQSDCAMLLPAEIGDFTDFNAGIHHAANGGRRRKLPTPLLPNYCYVPIAYHSRASSVRVSGTDVIRPIGQWLPNEGDDTPVFGPSNRIDFELELGIWISRSTDLGETIPITSAPEYIAGFCLLNDWSARDIQAWESQRLGPFLGKNFLTTVSPWVVSPEALAPFRIPAFERTIYPEALPHLRDPADQARGGLGLDLEVLIMTEAMGIAGLPPQRLTASNANALFWTPAQMITHQASNGCPVRAGDLIGTGTISLEDSSGFGSMLELSDAGAKPIPVGGAETRGWLCDGDEITFTARAQRRGYVSIGFGTCTGRVVPARMSGARS